MNGNNELDAGGPWGQIVLVVLFIGIMGFIMWQKWLKPAETDADKMARTTHSRHIQPNSSQPLKNAVPESAFKNETINEVNKGSSDVIPIVERDAGLLDRQGDRLRKEAEASRNNVDRGPRAAVLTEAQIRALEKKKAILQ